MTYNPEANSVFILLIGIMCIDCVEICDKSTDTNKTLPPQIIKDK